MEEGAKETLEKKIRGAKLRTEKRTEFKTEQK